MKMSLSCFATFLICIFAFAFGKELKKRSTPAALYARSIDGTGPCFRVASGNVSANFDTNVSWFNEQATIWDSVGDMYLLFADRNCTDDVCFL